MSLHYTILKVVNTWIVYFQQTIIELIQSPVVLSLLWLLLDTCILNLPWSDLNIFIFQCIVCSLIFVTYVLEFQKIFNYMWYEYRYNIIFATHEVYIFSVAGTVQHSTIWLSKRLSECASGSHLMEGELEANPKPPCQHSLYRKLEFPEKTHNFCQSVDCMTLFT
jgi:hypothetical protein